MLFFLGYIVRMLDMIKDNSEEKSLKYICQPERLLSTYALYASCKKITADIREIF